MNHRTAKRLEVTRVRHVQPVTWVGNCHSMYSRYSPDTESAQGHNNELASYVRQATEGLQIPTLQVARHVL